MQIKLFEQFEIPVLNENTIDTPNFSIVTPGGCNGKCDFCFWKKSEPCGNYIQKLQETLNSLPSQFYQISITGGEPTLSPYFEKILNVIDRQRFTHVVLTTNGANLMKVIPKLKGKVDHVNISRHHYNDTINESVFKTKMSSKEDLKRMTRELNKIGIDVTFSAVLSESLNNEKAISSYISFAKSCGATQVFFRKPHGTLEPSVAEKLYEGYKSDEYSCPVCRTSVQLIEGMKVAWKASLMEPSKAMGKIYELVYSENGKLTKDWEGKLKVDYNKINETVYYAGKEVINEECGGGSSSSCGGDSSAPRHQVVGLDQMTEIIRRNRASAEKIAGKMEKSKKRNTKDIIKTLYDFYINDDDENNINPGDSVIYKFKGSEYDGMEFEFIEIREADGKYKLSRNGKILYASPNRVEKEFKEVVDKMGKLNSVLDAMVASGKLQRGDVDKFIKRKIVDPYDEEIWGDEEIVKSKMTW